ncbi:MAG: DUF4132 domain-containing protein [Polyangiales bacterium]
MNERYEYREGKSAKFWAVSVDGTAVTTNWGRIGTDGQSKEKDYADDAAALKDAKKVAASKVKKGYVLCGAAPKKKAAAKKAAPKKAATKKTAATKAAPKKATTRKSTPKKAAARGAPEVDLSELEEVPAGWGYGQPGVPPLPAFDLEELRQEALSQLKMKELKKLKPGKSLAKKNYADWRYTGTLQGDQATSDELLAFVTGKSDELSEDGQVGLLHYGQSWYAPPIAVMRYHMARFGTMASFRSLCRFAKYHYDYKSHSLMHRGDYEVKLGECTGRFSQELFELRHAVALFKAKEYKAARDFAAAEWDKIHPLLRPGVAFVLNDADLAEAALETSPEIYYWNHHFCPGVATAEPEVAIKYVARVPGNFLAFAPAVIRQWGHRCIPLLTKVATGVRRKGYTYGDKAVCRALAATPDALMMSASVEFLRFKDEQKFIASQFEKRPDIGGEAVILALQSTNPAVRASARSVASLTNAKDALLPTGKAASKKALPAFLVTPPWSAGKGALKFKPQNVEMLPHKAKFVPPAGPKNRNLWPKGQKKVLERLERGYYHVGAFSLTQLTAAQFDEHVMANPDRVAGWDVGPLIEKFGEERVLAFTMKRSATDALSVFEKSGLAIAAPKVAEAYGLKTLRDRARAWLGKYPKAAVIGLTPQLFVKSKKRVALAVSALCAVGAAGHTKIIQAVAKQYGGDAEKALNALAELEELDIVPAKIPRLSSHFSLTSLDPPRLKKGNAYFGEEALQNFCTMLAFSTYEEEYPGIAIAAEMCTPESLEAFAHSAFETWLAQGADGKSSWAMLSLGWFAGDDAVRRLTPLIRKWPGEGGAKRAQLGLDVLAKIGTDAALSNVYSISQKLKYKSVEARATEVVQEIADGLGLTPEELGDRVVPDFGLDENGTTWIDFGPRKFQVRMDETLTPVVFDETGKRLKTLPKPGKSDDADVAKEEKKRFGALKKDLRSVSKQQVQRLELAMCGGRSWEADSFQQYFVDHPLIVSLVRRLVFACVPPKKKKATFFTVDESRQPIDAKGDAVTLSGQVTLVHAIDWPEKKRAEWGEYFADFELLQPFEQLARQTYDVADYKVKKNKIVDLGMKMPAPRWVFGIEKRGWSRYDIIDGGGFYAHERMSPDGVTAIINFEGAVAVSYIEEKEPVDVRDIVFSKDGKELAPKNVEARFVSEVLRDVEALRPD